MVDVIPLPDKKYRTIYADPPWYESGGGQIKRGADRHYDLMKTKDICSIPVHRLIHDEGCHLYLWVTNNFLEDGLEVMSAWGFEYKTMITWLKVLFNSEGVIDKGNIGLGQYYRGITEHCLFGVSKNKCLPYKIIDGRRQQGISGFCELKTEHSAKPSKMREYIERVSYPDYIELFAREHKENWDVWGNQAPLEVEQPKEATIDESNPKTNTELAKEDGTDGKSGVWF